MQSGVQATEPSSSGLSGQQIGAYELVEPIGHGGMGSVWLARRNDGRFEGLAAVKFLNSALVGRASEERFIREGRALGRLRHPFIAHLIDAGVSALGAPYLVLEYVAGVPIDRYCDVAELGIRERIRLLLDVASAVAHAHGNLIVHRDIKPSNVLIDGDGKVKLLDFGIAKLLDEEATGGQASTLTREQGWVLTPEYAAPEQATGDPITTATDVYSLGALLFELLSGERLVRGTDSPVELMRAIVETAAPRLSGVVAKISEQPPLLLERAQQRGTTPERWRRTLTGELETIVAKALKKQPAERYPSVRAFADDLERYLRHEPISARPDTWGYRLRKFSRRNWARLTLAAGLGLLLIAAAGVSLWQARVARGQQALAEREAKRAQVMLQFLFDLFSKNSDQQDDPRAARQLTARELLEIGADRAVGQLQGEPELQAAALDQLADMYSQLKLASQAGRLRRGAIDALKRALGPDHPDVAAALVSFAEDVVYTNQRAQAAQALAEARAILDRLGDDASETRGRAWIVAAQLARYDSLQTLLVSAEQAQRHFREHPPEHFWSGPFKAIELLGIARHLSGHYAEAEALQRDAIAFVDARSEHSAAWHVNPLIRIAESLYARGDMAAAINHLTEALEVSRRINGDSSGQTLQTQAKLGGFLYFGGRRQEGLALLDETLAVLRQRPAEDNAGAWGSLRQFRGLALFREGRIEEADELLASETQALREYYPDSIPLARVLVLHASVVLSLGRYDASAAALDEGCRLWQQRGGDLAVPALANDCWLGRAELALARAQPAEAVQWLDRVTPLPEPVVLQLDRVQAAIALARARLLQGAWEPARAAAFGALGALAAPGVSERHPQLVAAARLRLGQAEQQAGDQAGALRDLDAAVSALAANGDAQSPWLAEARTALAGCLLSGSPTPERRHAAGALLAQAEAARQTHPELGPHLLGR